MIRVQLQGRLGNQMFQYATALSLARRHGVGVEVDVTSYMHPRQRAAFELWRFQRLGLVPISITAALTSQVKRRLLVERAPAVTFRMQGLGFDNMVTTLPDGSVLQGWFQSERYFPGVAGEIRALFDLSAFRLPRGEQQLSRLRRQGEVVALHVRRGDYVGTEMFDVGLTSYYAAAIERMRATSDRTFLVFSDDIAWCREQLIFKGEHFEFLDREHETTPPVHEMALMACCDHHIISNSTFAWWAAWLATSSRRAVILPRQWLSRYDAEQCGLSFPGWIEL